MYLYEISTPDTVYIGITSDISRRKREHLNHSHNTKLRNSIMAYPTKVSFTIILEGDPETVFLKEKEAIAEYRSRGAPLANISKGGQYSGGMQGEEHWNSILHEEDIINIRELYASNAITQRNLAKLYNIGYKAISKIVRGQRWAETPGPITMSKQEISKVANRRVLTDDEVVYIRETCMYIYNSMGKFNIPDFAELYEITPHSFRSMLKGTTYKILSGPILGKDYWKSFGKV